MRVQRVSWVQLKASGLSEHVCMLPLVLYLCFLLLGSITWPILPRAAIFNAAWAHSSSNRLHVSL